MDDGDEIKAGDTELDPSSKNMLLTKGSCARPGDERDADQRNRVGKNSSRVQKLWNAKMTIFQLL
ncbi:Macrophage colony-stimulating factor 1 receptor [Gossypium arboreum]|uniref:Macrophage colony-stimulating factor 1 receptor n=1 Tax=Gossypium arboreum TaxID=29729 RepID=A0A0B0MA84_GOSAR|nr:Macrophage colony-stimulating factor 1 receptor [Gossypium arboreum]